MAHWYDAEEYLPNSRHPVTVQMGAQYRFVPLHREVAPAPVQFGSDRAPISHIRPVGGGISGVLKFKLRAETPVLFGSVTRMVGNRPVTEHSRFYDEGPYAATGRAIKGLIRSVYGVVTFSRFNPLNGDHRFASRNMELLQLETVKRKRGNHSAPYAAWLVPKLSAESVEWKIFRLKPQQTKKDRDLTKLEVEQEAAHEFRNVTYTQIIKLFSPCDIIDAAPEDLRFAWRTGDLKARALTPGFRILLKRELRRSRPDLRGSALNAEVKKQLGAFRARIGITDVVAALAGWSSLGLNGRSKLLETLAARQETLFLNNIAISGPRRKAYVVTADDMAMRENETLFDLPPEDARFEDIDTTAINAFLFNNSDYAKAGAVYPMGGRRAPRGNFDLFLRSYLLGLHNTKKEELCRNLARRLGVTGDPRSWTDVRNDAPPGIPVYCYGDPASEGFEMGTSKMVPKQPAGSVESFLPDGHKNFPGDSLDWADALFGMVGDGGEGKKGSAAALKSRLVFDFASVEPCQTSGKIDMLCEEEAFPVLQGEPSASYDPFYLRKVDGSVKSPPVWALDDNAEVSGYKRYPAVAAQPENHLEKPIKLASQKPPSDMHSLVRPLNRGLDYNCRVEFHNIHPLELGALLFAVTFGDAQVFEVESNSTYRHVGGRLRNQGFGRLRAHSAGLVISHQNTEMDGALELSRLPDRIRPVVLMRAFEIAMGRFVSRNKALDPEKARGEFYDNRTIRALLNISRSDWPGDQLDPRHVVSRSKGGMFHLPYDPDNNEALFKSFAGLRKLVYAGRRVPETGSILDEFLQPPIPCPDCEADVLNLADRLTTG